MPALLTILDESAAAARPIERTIELPRWGAITLRELIERTAQHESALRAKPASKEFAIDRIDISEEEAERNSGIRSGIKNQPGDPRNTVPDPAAEAKTALTGFAAGRFIVVVDGRQANDLDEEIMLSPESQVRFIRLLPLAGG